MGPRLADSVAASVRSSKCAAVHLKNIGLSPESGPDSYYVILFSQIKITGAVMFERRTLSG